MIKHAPKARHLCINCFNDNHNKHNKPLALFGIKLVTYDDNKCECPICNYCSCDWCKQQRSFFGIKELT